MIRELALMLPVAALFVYALWQAMGIIYAVVPAP